MRSRITKALRTFPRVAAMFHFQQTARKSCELLHAPIASGVWGLTTRQHHQYGSGELATAQQGQYGDNSQSDDSR